MLINAETLHARLCLQRKAIEPRLVRDSKPSCRYQRGTKLKLSSLIFPLAWPDRETAELFINMVSNPEQSYAQEYNDTPPENH